jgi:hypothetical protein
MNSAEKTALGYFTSFAAKGDRHNGLSLARQRGIRPENWPRSLQHIGTTAKKCPFLASRSPDSEATAASTTFKALPGCAKAHGFPLARDLTADGRIQTSV